MDCKEAGRCIVEYVCDGDACPRRLELARHIAECASCRGKRRKFGRSLTPDGKSPSRSRPEFWEQRQYAFSAVARVHPVEIRLLDGGPAVGCRRTDRVPVRLRYPSRQMLASSVTTNAALLPSDENMNDLVESIRESDPDLALKASSKNLKSDIRP